MGKGNTFSGSQSICDRRALLQPKEELLHAKLIKDHSPDEKSPRIRKCWVPKKLLEAQGYYKGVCNVWIPRRVPNASTPMHHLDTKLLPGNQQKSCTVSKQWRPKRISTPVLQKKTMVTTTTTTSRTVKGLSMSYPYQPHYLEDNFSLQLLQAPPTQHNSCDPTIQQRANSLQAMLFGKSSLPPVKSLQYSC